MRSLNKAFTIQIDGLLSMRPKLKAAKSGLVTGKLALVRLGIGKQFENLQPLCLCLRLRFGRGRSPKVVHGLRQWLVDTIGEHGLERRSRRRRWRQAFVGS